MMNKDRLFIGVFLILFGFIGGIFSFYYIDNPHRLEVPLELFKFFLFSCAVGGAVAVYSDIDSRNIKARELEDARQRFRLDIWRASNQIALARRMLRSASSETTSGLEIRSETVWFEHLRRLNEGQLAVEELRRLVQSEPVALASLNDTVMDDLRIIDQYVRAALADAEKLNMTSLASSDQDVTNLTEFLYAKDPPEYVAAFNRLNQILL